MEVGDEAVDLVGPSWAAGERRGKRLGWLSAQSKERFFSFKSIFNSVFQTKLLF
jgi:hypothetical protein